MLLATGIAYYGKILMAVGANQWAWIRFAVQPESVLALEFYAADTDAVALAVHYISFIVADTENQVI